MEGLKTYTGIIVTAAGLLLKVLKIDVVSDQEINSIVTTGMELAGLLLAAYGRYKAKPKTA